MLILNNILKFYIAPQLQLMALKIQVTKTTLPSKKEYFQYIDQIWKNGWLTNNGPLSLKLELELKSFLGVPYLQFISNGTIALQLAINSLKLDGEIITTPYSYVATTSAILWENCKPVFCDIKKGSFNIDADLIESKITSKTCAILATHVYGIPCDVKKIEQIAKKHNLKVIYDAAHAFGVKIGDTSIFNYGDISITSFHATKIFHTIEGGAVITQNKELDKLIGLGKTFGHVGDDHKLLGINGKNSEFHAAMGLCNLKTIQDQIEARQEMYNFFCNSLVGLPIKTLFIPTGVTHNYAYFPIVFKNNEEMIAAKDLMEKNEIYPRRYFYPSLNRLPYIKNKVSCPISEDISEKVLCLPFYPSLSIEQMERIFNCLKRALNYV